MDQGEKEENLVPRDTLAAPVQHRQAAECCHFGTLCLFFAPWLEGLICTKSANAQDSSVLPELLGLHPMLDFPVLRLGHFLVVLVVELLLFP